ncbi:hypothetical protein, partial [Delftia tsuruhatensis]
FESRHADHNAKLLTETSGAFCFVRSILRAIVPCGEGRVQFRQAAPSRMARAASAENSMHREDAPPGLDA